MPDAIAVLYRVTYIYRHISLMSGELMSDERSDLSVRREASTTWHCFVVRTKTITKTRAAATRW